MFEAFKKPKIFSDPYNREEITSRNLQINLTWILLQWLFHNL